MNLTNTQFVFEGKTKRVLFGGMALGLLCLVLTFINDDEYHTRFWTNILHNSVYFTGIALMAMFFMSAQITAFAGWNSVIRRILEAMSQFLWVGLILMAIIAAGVWGHFHHLYHWNDPNVNVTDPGAPHFDRIIAGKKGFLNPMFYTIATVGFLAVWYFWAQKVRSLSMAQDTGETASFDYYKKIRRWSASFLPLAGFLSPVFLWLVMMSIDPHWYSTMFAWYSTASIWLGSISFTVLIIIYLKAQGYLQYVTHDHLHDVGKYLFGITVFWTYLWFDQYMLIWYANNGEETIYFNERVNHYPVLFWGNLVMNFVAPFLILMRNDTKRKFGTMFFAAVIVFFGHWWDYFYMIKPGARIAAFEAKELAEGGHVKSHEAAPISEAAHEEAAKPAEQTAAHPEEAVTHAEGDTMHSETATAHSEAAPAHEAPATEATAAGHGDEAAGHDGGDAHGDSHVQVEPNGFRMGFTIPGLEDIGVMIGFLSLFLFFFFGQLTRTSLVPLKDPFLEESLHHETGALIESEQQEGDHHH
ncbi:MAG TPA: hypothetical protein PK228_03660 [Saprospiraceae bacterium]|nr:hypothetical protein [Saprospiraceae bacterium]